MVWWRGSQVSNTKDHWHGVGIFIFSVQGMGLGHLVCGHDLPLLLEDLSITLSQQLNNLLSICFVEVLGQWV